MDAEDLVLRPARFPAWQYKSDKFTLWIDLNYKCSLPVIEQYISIGQYFGHVVEMLKEIVARPIEL